MAEWLACLTTNLEVHVRFPAHMLLQCDYHSLYPSLNIVTVIKSRRLRWVRHVARMEEGRTAMKVLTGKQTVSYIKGGMQAKGI